MCIFILYMRTSGWKISKFEQTTRASQILVLIAYVVGTQSHLSEIIQMRTLNNV